MSDGQYRVSQNGLGKFIPEFKRWGDDKWLPMFIFGNSEFDTLEEADRQIKRRQTKVVKTYD